MISAEEARVLSEKNSGIREELEKIDSEIRKAAMHGNTKVIYELDVPLCKALFLQLAESLHDSGFSVAWFNNLNKLIIRW